MSSKQLRKLEAQRAGAAGKGDGGSGSDHAAEASDDSEPEPQPRPQRAAFAMLAGSSDESDEDGARAPAEAAREVLEPESQAATAPKSKAKKGKKKKGKGATKQAEPAVDDEDLLLDGELAAAAAENAAASVAPGSGPDAHIEATPFPLAMNKADFSVERERKRVFGDGAPTGSSAGNRPKAMALKARGRHEGRFTHYRRLFMIEPSEDGWPRPEGCAEMTQTSDADGGPVFDIKSTPAHRASRMDLLSVQLTHDPNEVQQLVMERPFCVEALLLFADICRGAGEHEHAFQLIRQAAYAVECSFDAGFSPFCESGAGRLPKWPRVRLAFPRQKDPAWPGWLWLAALREYMLGLFTQGLNRTAIEVCKLLLAMALPRDPMHVLMYLDVLCLRARQFSLLQQLALHLVAAELADEAGATLNLACMLPNFAYSVALAGQLALGEAPDLAALNRVTVSSVLPSQAGAEAPDPDDEDAWCAPHAALMRALLLFPQVLQPLLEGAGVKLGSPAPAGSTCRLTWQEIFTRKPFFKFGEFRHERHFMAHALMADAYAHHGAPLWRGEATLRWLHACAGRLVQMCESSLFDGEFSAARREWKSAPLGLQAALSTDYAQFSASEMAERRLPAVALEALNFDAEIVSGQMRSAAAGGPGPAPAAALDEESQLARAMELSRQGEESRQRRSLIQEQEAELQESLAVDRARAAAAQRGAEEEAREAEPEDPVAPAAVAQLVDMGFEPEDAKKALRDAAGDTSRAVALLTS